MRFETIPGKVEIKKQLIQSAQSEKIPHAQLFLGKEGSAALAMALAFSTYIHCTDKKEEDSCGICPACLKSSKMMHPDTHFAFPVVKSETKKREDTTSEDFILPFKNLILSNPFASFKQWIETITTSTARPNINVKETNLISQRLSLQSFESDYKILIMWMPEYLGREGNRLLKLIEEPPDKTVILLVAEDSELLLPTVLSRCQITKIPLFTNKEIKSVLQGITGSTNIDESVINLSAGNISRAIELLKSEDDGYGSMLYDWLRLCYKSHPEDITRFCEDIARWNQEQQRNFIEYGLHFLRAFHYWYFSQTWTDDISESEKDIAFKMKSILNFDKIISIEELLNEAITHIYRNANSKILFFSLSLEIGYLLKS